MTRHCKLAPSAAGRWLRCPASGTLHRMFEDAPGAPARQGTVAHAIAETLLDYRRGTITEQERDRQIEQLRRDPDYIPDCEKFARAYADRISSDMARFNGCTVLLEQEVQIPVELPADGQVFTLFGTADCIILHDDTLNIYDFKSGRGQVLATDEDGKGFNTQLAVYGYGAYLRLKHFCEIKKIVMRIIQPAVRNSTVTTTPEELQIWAQGILFPGVRAALAPTAPEHQNAGAHCRYCSAKYRCVAYIQKYLEVPPEEVRELETFELLPAWKLSQVLDRLAELSQAYDDVKKYAAEVAVTMQIPGYSLQRSRGKRTWNDASGMAEELRAMGLKDEEIYTLKSPYQIEKALEKKGLDTGTVKAFTTAGKGNYVIKRDERPADPDYKKAIRKRKNETLTPPGTAPGRAEG